MAVTMMRRKNNNTLEICGEDSEVIFHMEESYEDGVFKMKLCGEIRNEVAYEFEDELMAALLGCKKVELDFNKVSYIASNGLRSLLSAQQMAAELEDTGIWIRNVSGDVKEAFQAAGFFDILEIFPQ